jgi:hypothetical protein
MTRSFFEGELREYDKYVVPSTQPIFSAVGAKKVQERSKSWVARQTPSRGIVRLRQGCRLLPPPLCHRRASRAVPRN